MSRQGRLVGSDEEEESTEGLYFADLAEVGNETEEEVEEESESERDRHGTSLNQKGRKTLKVCRHFAYALIENAKSSGWEDEAVANLIELVAEQLNFDEAKVLRCLEKTAVGSPNILATLIEGSRYHFTVPQLVSVLLCHANSTNHFISLMGEAMECDLFNLSDPATIEVVRRTFVLIDCTFKS